MSADLSLTRMPAREDEYSTLGAFEEQAEMIRLFGREVIPAFRD